MMPSTRFRIQVVWPVLFLVLAGPATASFEIIGDGEATDIAADGSVVVGRSRNTNETWLWTRDSGQQWLGRTARAGDGPAAGAPDISDDGTVVSATVRAEDARFVQPGLWSSATGWIVPQRVGDSRNEVAWGVSGDGSALVGGLVDPGEKRGSAAPAIVIRDGVVNRLENRGRNCRANEANYDGTVIVGWSADPGSGTRQPTVWTDSGMTILDETSGVCQAAAVSPDGKIIVGQVRNEVLDQRVAALWLKSDFGWVQEPLGVLPMTESGEGQAMALDLASDGRVIVGYNGFDGVRSTGFVWTPERGIMDVHDYLKDFDITLPDEFRIVAVTAVSDDGKVLAGYGDYGPGGPSGHTSFLVHTGETSRPNGGEDRLPAGLDFLNPFRTREME